MLDYFAIFTKGGALLWTLQFAALKHSPVDALNSLIRTCLLEEKSAETVFTFYPKTGAAQALKWSFNNGLGLVFVAVYQKTLSLLYVDELLQRVKAEFVPKYKPNVYEYQEFDDVFRKLLQDCESSAEAAKRGGNSTAANAIQVTVRSGVAPRGAKGGSSSSGGKKGKGASSDDADAAANRGGRGKGANGADVPVVNVHADGGKGAKVESATSATSDEERSVSAKSGAFDVSKLSSKGPRGRGARVAKKEDKTVKKDEPAAGPKKKVPRRWNTTSEDPKELTQLDYSAQDAEDEATGASSDSGSASGTELPLIQSRMDEEEEEYEDDEEELAELEREFISGKGASAANGTKPAKKSGVLGSFMSRLALNVVGKGALSAADLQPALVEMKKKLMERNVAEAIAEKVCNSVGAGLEGKKLSSFTGLSAFVKSEFEEALSGILNKRQMDVLLDIQNARSRGRPYVIVFCGVNGVGKSTNLAKICYWLLQHNCKPMIAACDTFRAGAVEQLKTHCTRLKVPLYERGYEKDPAKVASECIKQAARDGRDVVLVDTAGRMQDNEPLMRALSNLINLNNPNLVLFVGEALVGNDAVDQLVKFNRALYDLSPANATRRHAIDGIVLTKFDTIDDKVGAAVSMVYSSGAPVMFVGCGQTYVDLKKLNVKSVVKALLS